MAPDVTTRPTTDTDATRAPRPGTPVPPARAGSEPAEAVTEQLRLVLDGHRPELREEIRRTLRAPWFEPPTADETTADLETRRARTLARLRQLAGTGIQRIGFDAEAGGREAADGPDLTGPVMVVEMLGLGDLSLMVKAGVQWGLFSAAIQALGTRRHHAAYLPDALDATLAGCFAMTETGHGSDVQRLRTTATYDPGTEEFVVHTPEVSARKDYIGNAARDGRLAVVFAQLETLGEQHGVHALVVPVRDPAGRPCPGVTIEDCGAKGGLAGVDNGRLAFDRVRVPREALLDRFATVAPDGTYHSAIASPGRRFFTTIGALVRGRVGVGGAATSATRVALAIAVRYALQRRQFPAPGSGEETVLLDYPSHQRRLLPPLARTYALTLAQDALLQQVGSVAGEEDQRRVETLAAGMKAVATRHAVDTVQACREACGGAGYLTENRLVGLRADLDVFTTFEGDNTVLLQLVAKGLLTEYRHHLGELDAVGTARAVASQVGELIAERVGALSVSRRLRDGAPRRGTSPLLDPRVQAALLADRERHVLDGLARRLRRASGDDAEAYRSAARTQDHMAAAARAHVDRFLLESLQAAVDRADGEARRLLSLVRDLTALSTIESDLAWFLLHDRLDGGSARAVTALVDDVCARLRPHARTLVDAFAIDEAWLGAPIAADA